MGQNKRASPEDIVLRPGRRPRHGGYTYIRTGKLPKKKAAIERYLTWVRMTYAEDIAGEESNLTAGQTVLLNKLVLLEGIARCIETTAAEVTESTGQLYNMPTKYLSYVNVITKICGMLGIERRVLEPEATLAEVIASIEKEKSE